MLRLHEIQAKVGMRVKLTHPLKKYTFGLHNPVVGSEWETEGSIINIKNELYTEITVRWDNARENTYSPSTLSLADTPEGSFESIWD